MSPYMAIRLMLVCLLGISIKGNRNIMNDIKIIDAVVNIWTEEALSIRPDWGTEFFVEKMKNEDSSNTNAAAGGNNVK